MTLETKSCNDCIFKTEDDLSGLTYCSAIYFLDITREHIIENSSQILPTCPLKTGGLTICLSSEPQL